VEDSYREGLEGGWVTGGPEGECFICEVSLAYLSGGLHVIPSHLIPNADAEDFWMLLHATAKSPLTQQAKT
jgi:hypothetical protein